LRGRKLSVICAYAPTNDYPDSEKDTFYSEVQEALDRSSSRDLLLMGGDFNAQVGAEDPHSWQGSLGKFALHKASLKSNDMTQRLLNSVCQMSLCSETHSLTTSEYISQPGGVQLAPMRTRFISY